MFKVSVPGAVAEQEIAAAVLLNPHRTLGQPEVLAQDFEFGIGCENPIERRVEAHQVVRNGPDHLRRSSDGQKKTQHHGSHSSP